MTYINIETLFEIFIFESIEISLNNMDIVHKLTEKYGVTLSEQSMNRFISILERMEYQKGDIILGQRKVSNYMYIIEKGIIRQFYYKDGRDITEHFSCEGDIATCLESLFLKTTTDLIVEVIEPSVVYLLNYAKWESLCDEFSDINN